MSYLRVLRVANLVMAALASLVALFGLLFLLAGIIGDPQPADTGGKVMFIVYGLIVFGLGGGLAAAHAYTGLMITAGRARAMQTTLACLHLANFPIGTAYAVFAWWVCWLNPETVAIFERPEGRRVD